MKVIQLSSRIISNTSSVCIPLYFVVCKKITIDVKLSPEGIDNLLENISLLKNLKVIELMSILMSL